MGLHLVGRRHEFGELARVVAGAATGEGALVVLSGEAGIGKSTMLSWLAETAASADMPVLAGRAVADEGASAFWPWSRVFAAGRGLGLSPDLLEIGSGPLAQARFVGYRCGPPQDPHQPRPVSGRRTDSRRATL